MRTLIILGALATIAFMAGLFTVDRDSDHTTIQFNREEIRSDARQAIDKGRDFLNKEDVSEREGSPMTWVTQ